MAFTTTTLAAALAEGDTTIVVASATGFAANYLLLVDQEMMRLPSSYVSGTTTIPNVIRGVESTAGAAHVSGANITVGLATDFASPASGGPSTAYQTQRAKLVTSYSASGAIALPTAGTDLVVILNGTSVLTMTLANPTKDMDGCELTIIGNGAAAHTVTYTAGFGGAGASYDVLTANGTGTAACKMIACNALWNLYPGVTGTLTNNAWALA